MGTLSFGQAKAGITRKKTAAEAAVAEAMPPGVDSIIGGGIAPGPKPSPVRLPVPMTPPAGVAGAVAEFDENDGAMEGEFTSRDIKYPFLTLGQRSSAWVSEHPDWIGSFIYNNEISLGPSIEVVFVRMLKYYLEDLPFGDSKMPRRWNKAEEFRLAGFHEDQVVPVADMNLLVRCPEGGLLSERGLVQDETDRDWFPVRFICRSKTSYNALATTIVADYASWLKGNLLRAIYTLTGTKRVGAKGPFHVPQPRRTGAPSEVFYKRLVEAAGRMRG